MTTWTVRAETPGDKDAVWEVNAAAFPTAAEADLVDALRRDAAWLPGLSIVACDADLVVAYALLTRCYIGSRPALALAPCSVLPPLQGRGAGSAAIRGALDAARSAGESVVVVLGHPRYYPRFGFERASRHGIAAPIEVPDDALMVLALRSDVEIPSGTIAWAAPFGV